MHLLSTQIVGLSQRPPRMGCEQTTLIRVLRAWEHSVVHRKLAPFFKRAVISYAIATKFRIKGHW